MAVVGLAFVQQRGQAVVAVERAPLRQVGRDDAALPGVLHEHLADAAFAVAAIATDAAGNAGAFHRDGLGC